MKQVNVRELHERTGAMVDLAAEGHVVTIFKRGRAVAELRPLSKAERRKTMPDRTALLSKYPQLSGDSGRFLEEDRS